MQHPATLSSDPGTDRQAAILDAAFGTFAAYGFRRTTMEDIARAAGLSRTALYLHFRNKDDILRSLTQRHFDLSLQAMAAALAVPGQTTDQALIAAFIAKDGNFAEALLETPHGAELLDTGLSVAADIVKAGGAAVADVLCRWLETRGIPADLGPPRAMADMIVAALMGLKASSTSLDDLRAAQAHLARMVARAIG